MKPEDFYKLIQASLKRLKGMEYSKMSLYDWQVELDSFIREECADNMDKYPEEGDECD